MKRMMIPLAAMMMVGVCAFAQQGPQPLTSVAIFKIKPNKTSDWVAVMKGVFAPALDQLLKDGVITAYGADMDMLHQAGKPNASAWISMPSSARAIAEAGWPLPSTSICAAPAVSVRISITRPLLDAAHAARSRS